MTWASQTRSADGSSKPSGISRATPDTHREGVLEERKADVKEERARAEERAERKDAEVADLERRT